MLSGNITNAFFDVIIASHNYSEKTSHVATLTEQLLVDFN